MGRNVLVDLCSQPREKTCFRILFRKLGLLYLRKVELHSGSSRPKMLTRTFTFCFSRLHFIDDACEVCERSINHSNALAAFLEKDTRGLGFEEPSDICELICAMSFSFTGTGFVPPRKPVTRAVFLTRW